MKTRTFLMAIAVLFVAGCTATEFKPLGNVAEKLPLMKKEPEVQTSEYTSPAQMVAIWSDAVYTQPGHPPIRGFGGRLYFYNEKSEAVPVEGQLVVYSYDDSDKGSPAKAPDRKFVFTPEQLTQYFSPSELGASYSIWLPLDEVGGVCKAITLLPVFTSADGNVVMGHQTINNLPGTVPENVETQPKGYFTPLSPTGHGEVRPASYQQPQREVASTRDQWDRTHMFVPKDTTRKRLRSTTIQVPMTMSKRLVEAPSTGAATIGFQGDESEERIEGARRTPPVNNTDWEGSEAAQSWPRQADVSATGPPLPSPPATRFERPRYQVPAEPHGRPNRVHPPTSPVPAGPQPGRPFPPSSDRTFATAGS